MFHVRNMYMSSIAYVVFTLTDGGARTIVLLHAHQLGFNAIEIALMFALYELMGVATNLAGGFFGSQHGLRFTVMLSLVLQLVGFTALACTGTVFGELKDATDSVRFEAFWWIASCQALNGIAKDLMKLAGKSTPKLVTGPNENSKLFKLVAYLTGMKNSMKGLGYFVGGLLLAGTGYVGALAIMGGFIAILAPFSWIYLDSDLGIAKKRPKCSQVFNKNRNVNILSGARFFLFGSRDIWFEVAAPLFLAAAPLDWSDGSVGGFMAGYTIIYGQFQALTATAFKTEKLKRNPNNRDVVILAMICAVLPAALGGLLYVIRDHITATQVVLIMGVALYAIVFAANSSVHSFMIVLYSNRDKVAMDLGFYYMANAGGRLVGTVASGFVFYHTKSEYGLSVCLWISSAFLLGAALVSMLLDKPQQETSV